MKNKDDNLLKQDYLTDYEPIFSESKNKKNQSDKVVLKILFKKKFLIFLSVILCLLKHLPPLLLPLITAEIIDTVDANNPQSLYVIINYAIISIIVIA